MWVVLLACFGIGACLISCAWGFHVAYGRSSHFFSVRYSIDHSSLPCELIDICCYLRGVNASVACLVFFSIDSSLTVVVNVWALSGPFSPCCCLILFCFSYQCSVSVTNVQFQLPMFRWNVQVYVLSSTVMGNVQPCCDFSRDAIQLAPSIESNVPYQDVIVQMFRRYSSSPQTLDTISITCRGYRSRETSTASENPSSQESSILESW